MHSRETEAFNTLQLPGIALGMILLLSLFQVPGWLNTSLQFT